MKLSSWSRTSRLAWPKYVNSTGTIGDAVGWCLHLEQAGIDEANSEARLIMSYSLGLTRSEIINRNDEKLSEDQITRCRSFAERRSAGTNGLPDWRKRILEPPFQSLPETLIPRRIQKRLWMRSWIMPAKQEHQQILDIGTGSVVFWRLYSLVAGRPTSARTKMKAVSVAG